MTPPTSDHDARQRAAAAEAAAYLREHDPRTAAEQAALDAVTARRWMPLWADDYSTGVILLLSRAGLLRDRAREQQDNAAGHSMARMAERDRRADQLAIANLDALAEHAADRLDSGEDPADVARWLRETRMLIVNGRDRARSATAEHETPGRAA